MSFARRSGTLRERACGFDLILFFPSTPAAVVQRQIDFQRRLFRLRQAPPVSLSVDEAQARVGRPLTPVSVAGVARRQNRRAAYGYGVGAGVAGAAAVATAGAIAATSPGYYGYGNTGWGNTGWGNPTWTNAYAAQQSDRYYGQPYYAVRAYSGASPYYGYTGWEDYSGRNFLKCAPGTMTKLDDGRMYVCQ